MLVLLNSGIEAVTWLAKQLSAACANRNARLFQDYAAPLVWFHVDSASWRESSSRFVRA
jgi:hypothetical protein